LDSEKELGALLPVVAITVAIVEDRAAAAAVLGVAAVAVVVADSVVDPLAAVEARVIVTR
jgi:hypothetical protein